MTDIQDQINSINNQIEGFKAAIKEINKNIKLMKNYKSAPIQDTARLKGMSKMKKEYQDALKDLRKMLKSKKSDLINEQRSRGK